MLCLLYIYCFFPLFSPVDPKTDAAPVIDYVDDDPSLPEQPGKPPPLIIPISPIPFSHACIRFCYCYCLHLFWCIACFCTYCCTLPAYPKLLSIGWLVIHQWPPPCPCCPCFIIEDTINRMEDQAPTPHITFTLVVRHCWVTIECRGWDLYSTSDVNPV